MRARAMQCESLLNPAAIHAWLLPTSGEGGDNLAGGVLLFGVEDEEDEIEEQQLDIIDND
jgi:hypothetical protein